MGSSKSGTHLITDAQHIEINRLYHEDGMLMKDIAPLYNVSAVAIHKHIENSRGRKQSGTNALKMSNEIAQEMNTIYDKGYNMAKVAKKTGFSTSTVCKYIWDARPRGTQMFIK